MKSEPVTDLRTTTIQALTVMENLLTNPKPLSAPLIDGWVLVFQTAGVTPEMVRDGLGKALQTLKWFPTPGEFLKLIRPVEDTEAQEELAWQTLLKVLRKFGGYASLCAADFNGDCAALAAVARIRFERLAQELTEENRAIWRAEFARTYRGALRGMERPEYLPGRWERENDAAGRTLTPALAGRPDWPELPRPREALPPGSEFAPIPTFTIRSLPPPAPREMPSEPEPGR